MEENHWGFHFILNMKGCNEFVNDKEAVKAFLQELVEIIDMIPIGEPVVVFVDSVEGKGVSGFQLITTSHIGFHGDDEDKQVYLDVFSCAPFETKKVIEYAIKIFQPTTHNEHFLYRDA